MSGVSTIIVSRDLRILLQHCLSTLKRAADACDLNGNFEIIIVDNASQTPYRVEDFPIAKSCSRFEIIRYDRHHSFAKSNNEAVKKCKGEYLFLINNDVLLHEDALNSALRLMKREANVGICGSRLLFPDGSIQHCGTVFGAGNKGPFHVHRGVASHLVPRMNQERQAVTGACMLIARQLWEELGGFDEAYPFGLEDVDLCLRARERGWRVFCCNEVDSIHFESMTPGRVELDVPSRKLFMKKWKGRYEIDAE
ncbi:MAG: hypothetical protein C5B54_11185 [Acidobacteria bacterium]|nr:MAG: hypothetical protein C5B54_11185 [Acidobacteriota bacterium]